MAMRVPSDKLQGRVPERLRIGELIIYWFAPVWAFSSVAMLLVKPGARQLLLEEPVGSLGTTAAIAALPLLVGVLLIMSGKRRLREGDSTVTPEAPPAS